MLLPKKGARPLCGLAPGGVCHAGPVTRPPVRSYRTLSPLPVPRIRFFGHRRFALCGTFPKFRPEDLHLAGVTRHPYFAEPGLSSMPCDTAAARPPGTTPDRLSAPPCQAKEAHMYRTTVPISSAAAQLPRYLLQVPPRQAGSRALSSICRMIKVWRGAPACRLPDNHRRQTQKHWRSLL